MRYFWLILTVAAVVWYTFVTAYVAFKGVTDIRSLDLVGFEKQLEGADLVITGEGKIDGQSLRGKVVAGIAERAKKAHVPVLVVVGDIGDEAEKAYDLGVSAIFSINRLAIPFAQARHHSKENLALTIDSLMRFQRLFDAD